jgi:peptide/nickel transport system permease protein
VYVSLIARRLLFLVLVLAGIAGITFCLSHLVRGDPVRIALGPRASAAAVTNMRHQLGLDQPLPVQFFHYVQGLLRGDFGLSLTTHRPVSQDLLDRLPATLELTMGAIGLVLLFGIPIGVLSAVKPGSAMDHIGRGISVLGVSVPVFWLGLMAQLVLFDYWGWLPYGGRLDSGVAPPRHITGLYTVDSLLTGNVPLFLHCSYYLLMPAAVLGMGSLAILTRQVRASMLEALAQDYVRTARAKGMPRLRVIVRHALRNALLPATTVMGLQIGTLLGGALLVEEVFAWPGIGQYATNATLSSDYNAVMGVTLVAAFLYVLVNLATDILYMVLDPRVTV